MKTLQLNKCALSSLMLSAVLALVPIVDAEAETEKTTLQDVEQETTELLRTLNEYGVEQRDEAVRNTEAALQRLDRRIDALEKRIDSNWEKMDQAARDNARASLSALRKQRMRVAEWYGGLKNSSAEAWGHMKTGFSRAYRSLSDAWEESLSEFGRNKPEKP